MQQPGPTRGICCLDIWCPFGVFKWVVHFLSQGPRATNLKDSICSYTWRKHHSFYIVLCCGRNKKKFLELLQYFNTSRNCRIFPLLNWIRELGWGNPVARYKKEKLLPFLPSVRCALWLRAVWNAYPKEIVDTLRNMNWISKSCFLLSCISCWRKAKISISGPAEHSI